MNREFTQVTLLHWHWTSVFVNKVLSKIKHLLSRPYAHFVFFKQHDWILKNMIICHTWFWWTVSDMIAFHPLTSIWSTRSRFFRPNFIIFCQSVLWLGSFLRLNNFSTSAAMKLYRTVKVRFITFVLRNEMYAWSTHPKKSHYRMCNSLLFSKETYGVCMKVILKVSEAALHRQNNY